MRPNISEFSYGYALTDELMHSSGSAIIGAPVFPSLYDEGQLGGGWDVKLRRPGVPLFLQFKLVDYMKGRSCKEHKTGTLSVPCYRMHLRPRRLSDQHGMLLDLEQGGNEVYYAAPAFHEPRELDDAYTSQTVRVRSLWIKPSAIGPLPDSKDHHVSFHHPGPWHMFSEPRRLDAPKDFETMTHAIETRLERNGSYLTSTEGLEELAESLSSTLLHHRRVGVNFERVRGLLQNAHPIRRIAYFAATFLEARLFIMSRG